MEEKLEWRNVVERMLAPEEISTHHESQPPLSLLPQYTAVVNDLAFSILLHLTYAKAAVYHCLSLDHIQASSICPELPAIHHFSSPYRLRSARLHGAARGTDRGTYSRYSLLVSMS